MIHLCKQGLLSPSNMRAYWAMERVMMTSYVVLLRSPREMLVCGIICFHTVR